MRFEASPEFDVLQVCAEQFPFIKTGGLADVTAALPGALSAQGCTVRTLLPGYPSVTAAATATEWVGTFAMPWGASPQLYRTQFQVRGSRNAATPGYFLDAPELFARPGNPYQDAYGVPYADNARRFAALGWAAAHLACGIDPHWAPSIVHAHDWHAGLAAACLAQTRAHHRQNVRSIFTIHNLAYQGLFAPQIWSDLGLPDTYFTLHGLEFHGQISFMKAGLSFADALTTVSPTYAREIQQPLQGQGLDGLLAHRADRLYGVLNGVDRTIWNPESDPYLAQNYSIHDMSGKGQCKATLQRKLGLALRPDLPLFGIVSRLTEQKGLHLLVELIDELVASGGQLFILGTGESWLEDALRRKVSQHPESVAAHLGYDEGLAHENFAAADFTLVPSRFEPCGLTQLFGLAYGTVPVVRRVGGLADTVFDCSLEHLVDGSANGVVFDEFSVQGLRTALRRALALFKRPNDLHAVRRRGMSQTLDWSTPARQYIDIYQASLRHGPMSPS